MSCYVIAHVTVTNPDQYPRYTAEVPGTIAAHGGEFLVRGGHVTEVEGTTGYQRHVVLRFPDRASAEAWYASPAYQEILPLRLANSSAVMIMVDGYEP